jgi:hypothetical protein
VVASVLLLLAACRAGRPVPEEGGPALPGAHPPAPAALDLDLERLLEEHRTELGPVAADPAGHRLQILVGQVEPSPGTDRPPTLRRSGYRVDAEYFYPASSVKLCGVVAAIELLQELNASRGGSPETPVVRLSTPLRFHPGPGRGQVEETDPTNLEDGHITVAHELRKIFLVSDNDAYNRLYDLVGPGDLNSRMWDLGLESVRLRHRLSLPLPPELNLRAPRVDVLLDEEEPLVLPARRSERPAPPHDVGGLLVGSAHIGDDGQRVEKPFDFSTKNRISLRDLQDLLVLVTRPDVALRDPHQPLHWSEAQYQFVWRAMSQLPGDSENPVYPREAYPDDFAKLALDGLLRVIPAERLRVYNKAGWAYGFLVENAYVVDEQSGRSFFFTVTLRADPDDVVGDDQYAYEQLGRPFLEKLAEILARRLLL